jgi:hypothetical protein
MKKIFLVIFLLFVLPNLSLADDWKPILKIRPIIEKDLDLLDKRIKEIDIDLGKSLEAPDFYRHSDWLKLTCEYLSLLVLKVQLSIAYEDLFVIETLLFYNKNLKGSKKIKDIIINDINDFKNTIEIIEIRGLSGSRPYLSYETIEVLDNIKSDLKEALEILK